MFHGSLVYKFKDSLGYIENPFHEKINKQANKTKQRTKTQKEELNREIGKYVYFYILSLMERHKEA